MRGVTLLPKELSGPNEWSWVLELPSHDVGPLIQQHRQVTVGMDPLREGRVHDGLRGWSDCDGLGKVGLSRLGHPSDLRRKSFDVASLFIECVLRHKHGEVAVLDAEFLDAGIKELSDLLPNVESRRPQNVTP